MKPNKSRLRLLVKELRSGKWEQGHEKLGDDKGRRCCLGVACEVYNRNNSLAMQVEIEGVGDNLPKLAADWFGIDRDPVLQGLPGHELVNATNWNDEHRKSFRAIATAFESTFDL